MKEFERIFDSIKQITLRPHERSIMREELKLFAAEHPAQAPFLVRVAQAFTFSNFRINSLRYHPLAAALVLFLCVGVGTSYAAEGALPGDVLYPVKIHVNESVQGALAVSNEAKAQWNVTRASRRLAEAETLAQEGKLTPAAQSDIESQFDQTTSDFNANVRALAAATSSAPAVAAVTSALAVTLGQHDVALAEVASTSSPQSRIAIDALRTKVRDRVQQADRVHSVADTFAILDLSTSTSPRGEGTNLKVHIHRTAATLSVGKALITTSSIASSTAMQIQATSTSGSSDSATSSVGTDEESPTPSAALFEAAVQHAQADGSQDNSHDQGSDSTGGNDGASVKLNVGL